MPTTSVSKIRYSETERKQEMAEAINLMCATTNLNKITSPYTYHTNPTNSSISLKLHTRSHKTNDSSSSTSHSLQVQMMNSRKKSRRRLITISTADGRWQGNWNSDYMVTLQDLRLQDLVEQDDLPQNPLVSINLSIHKHASFGFSVDGRIITSFTRKCSNCSSPYCREIDASFNVWVLQSSTRENRTTPLPEIGGDPSVIYVKPGNEAELDSLVQDTIRLATTVKDTCSESCEKSEPTMHYIGPQKTASMHKRWGRLLELRNANL